MIKLLDFDNRIIPWVDPISKSKLIRKGDFLVSRTRKYPIKNNIPIFIKNFDNLGQKQVNESFGYKWTNSNFGQNDKIFEEKLKDIILDFMGITLKDLSFLKNKIILDVGVGSGSTARFWASKAKEFHGIDISKAVFKAPNAIKNFCKNPILSQADLNHLPYENNSFDVVISNGVLHHTPNTKNSLKNIIKKLKINGDCLFYVYKKKAPIREFSDDFIRNKLIKMDPKKAIKEIESITKFGKELSEQNITIKITNDIPLLEIKKGEYDLQRFVYYNLFKCFWNSEWGYNYSNLVNFDWYHPQFAWRHSKEEIKNWCSEFKLKVLFIKETESGFTIRARKKL